MPQAALAALARAWEPAQRHVAAMAQRRYNTALRPGRAGAGAAHRAVVGMATKHSRRGLSRPSNPGAGIPAGGVLPPPLTSRS